jgi:hypothetical protein
VLCGGANSIFYGEKLLTTGNPDTERDLSLFSRLGLRPMAVQVDAAGHDHPGTVHADITCVDQRSSPTGGQSSPTGGLAA